MYPNNNRTKEVLIICSQQRSGTTVLRESLGNSSEIKNFGEILNSHKKVVHLPHNLCAYKQNWVTENLLHRLPTKRNGRQLLDSYFNAALTSCDQPIALFDIKYSDWHLFNKYDVLNSSTVPFLMKHLPKHNVYFIQLIRENKFAQYVSYQLAKKVGKWHYRKNDSYQKFANQIEIDCAACEKFIKKSLAEDERFSKLLTSFSHVERVTYESMFLNNDFAPEFREKLKNFLALSEAIPKPVLKKIITSTKEKITNHEEVLNYFHDSPFQEMIEQSLKH